MIHIVKKVIVRSALVMLFALSPFTVAFGQSVPDLQAQINVLLQRVQQLQAQLSIIQSGGTGRVCFYFNNNFGIGTFGGDVGPLVTALSTEGLVNSQNYPSGVVFDENLASAVSAFQQKYRNEILTPAGLSAGTGYVGARTRAKLNSLYGCSGTITPTPTPQPAGIMSIGYVQPNSGAVGNQVTIIGNGFTATGNRVRFGSTGSENSPSYSLPSYDGRTIVFLVPTSNYYACQYSTPACLLPSVLTQPGVYTVSVTNVNGTSNGVVFNVTSGGGIYPNNLAPTISYISPNSGSRSTEVTIIGSNFTPADSVQFSDYGMYVARNYVNSSTLTFTVPSGLANCNINGTVCTNVMLPAVNNGSYNVRVINSNGTSNQATFTVVNTQSY